MNDEIIKAFRGVSKQGGVKKWAYASAATQQKELTISCYACGSWQSIALSLTLEENQSNHCIDS